ncbi:hypothetical protein D3C72_2064750 [compost metagenome]
MLQHGICLVIDQDQPPVLAEQTVDNPLDQHGFCKCPPACHRRLRCRLIIIIQSFISLGGRNHITERLLSALP